MGAGESVMTVNFNKKVDESHIKSILESSDKKADFKKESTFEDTQHLQEYVGDTINIIRKNLTKLQEK